MATRTAAAAKRAKAPEPEPVRVPAAPFPGIYRCQNEHPAFPGQRCNKLLGRGSGALTVRCPRCKQLCSFENPTAADRR